MTGPGISAFVPPVRITDGLRITDMHHEEAGARERVYHALCPLSFWTLNFSALGHIDFETDHGRSTIPGQV